MSANVEFFHDDF